MTSFGNEGETSSLESLYRTAAHGDEPARSIGNPSIAATLRLARRGHMRVLLLVAALLLIAITAVAVIAAVAGLMPAHPIHAGAMISIPFLRTVSAPADIRVRSGGHPRPLRRTSRPLRRTFASTPADVSLGRIERRAPCASYSALCVGRTRWHVQCTGLLQICPTSRSSTRSQ